MNLIVTSITMVDLTNREAKRVGLSKGKNLITSEHNHVGKSVIMKSIYYSLGAEVFFPPPIKRISLFTFIDFELNQHRYRVARLKNSFQLYCDGVFFSAYSSVGDFGNKLSELFSLDISLVAKGDEKNIVKCPPAYYYLPYYIDQENGWSPTSSSFDRMSQFDLNQRKSSYFFHLGALDGAYMDVSKRKRINDQKIDAYIKDNEKYLTVIETLKERIDDVQMAFDSDSLERIISQRQGEIKSLLDVIAKTRSKLLEAEDQKTELDHEKDMLSKYIKNKPARIEEFNQNYIECPRCGIVFEQAIAQHLEKTYLLESMHDDYVKISEQIMLLERQIEKLRLQFREKQRLLLEFESTLAEDRASYNAYMKSKATSQLLREYQDQMGTNAVAIEELRRDNVEISKLLKGYAQEKEKTNSGYLSNLVDMFNELDVPENQVEDNNEPGSNLIVSGAYGPRCKIAQILAFAETQKRTAPEIISFPIVIDSPNALEQDSEHLENVIRTLLTWDKTDNQIIVASIQGQEVAKEIGDVNIILLSNEANHLFSSDDFIANEAEIMDIFTNF